MARNLDWFWIAPGKRCWPLAVGKTGQVIKISDFFQPNPSITPPNSGGVGTPAGTLAVFVETCMLTAFNNGNPITDQSWSVSFKMSNVEFTPADIVANTYAGSPPYMNMIPDGTPVTNDNAVDLIIIQGQWQEFTVFGYQDLYIGLKLGTSSPSATVVVPVMIALFQSSQG